MRTLPVLALAFAAYSTVLSAYAATPAPVSHLLFGQVYGDCTGVPINVLEVDGWPQLARYDETLDAFQALATCKVTEVDWTVHIGIEDPVRGFIPDADYKMRSDQLDGILAAIHANSSCDSDSECGTKVNNVCGAIDPNCKCTHGKKFTARVTIAGKECAGTCTDGTVVTVTCRHVSPCGAGCV